MKKKNSEYAGVFQFSYNLNNLSWIPQSEYELIPDYDIEVYTDGDTHSEDYVSEIWIPVKNK